MRDFILTKMPFGDRELITAALLEDGIITELIAEEAGRPSRIGNVYAGIVDSVSGNIGGAFVDIGIGQLCFLPLMRHAHVRPSEKILVQVTKDASGRKEAVLTENIHIDGRYAVVMRRKGPAAFSRKLSENRKEEIRVWLRETDTGSFGVLIRTNAGRAEKADVLSEIGEEVQELQEILQRFESAEKGALLRETAPFYLRFLRDLYRKPERAFTDIPKAAAALAAITGQAAGTEEETEGAVYRPPYGKALSLPALYDLPREMERLSGKKVNLKSGAFIVIEQTEAFVAIDVNTGHFTKGRKPEETYRRVNLEAAEEIARQIRLRNLSGMILVDFISMTDGDHNEELLNVMKKLVKSDHVLTEVIDLTPLGIMEIVRQKMRKPLAEVLSLC